MIFQLLTQGIDLPCPPGLRSVPVQPTIRKLEPLTNKLIICTFCFLILFFVFVAQRAYSLQSKINIMYFLIIFFVVIFFAAPIDTPSKRNQNILPSKTYLQQSRQISLFQFL